MRVSRCKFLIAFLLASFILPVQSWATGYTQTKYPIVLVHGLFGWDQIGPVEYFYNIPESLSSGGAQVFVSQVSAANSNEVRGEQLLVEVQQILAATGAAKVNLIGHSQGSPTIRYVASVRPDLVASVSTVGGVNGGSPIADILLGAGPSGSLSQTVIDTILNGLGSLIELLSRDPTLPQDANAALMSLSTAGTQKFNAAYPQGLPTTACGQGPNLVNGVHYFSWSGTQPATNFLDITDPFLVLTSLAFNGAPNDGLVGACSSHLGTVIRDNYGMNHLDEVNQLIGLVNIFETSPVTVFRQQANRLQRLGL